MRRRPTNQYGFKIGSSKKAEESKTNEPRRKPTWPKREKEPKLALTKKNTMDFDWNKIEWTRTCIEMDGNNRTCI